jgi:hypothetical protein
MKQHTRTLAISTIVFSGLISGAPLAYADEDDGVPTRHTEAPPSSPPNMEADSPINNQATATGFIDGSHFNLLFRSFTDHFTSEGAKNRDAWVLGNQAVFESGYTRGLFGVGLDASLFSAFKLNGGQGAGNRVHLDHNGYSGQNQAAWTYPGVWDVKARVSNTVVKYGQQLFDNPFLVPHDNRALPPTYRGVSLASEEIKNLTLKAGSVDAVLARGQTSVSSLTTEYGGTHFSRFTYAGGDYAPNDDTSVSLYVSRAENVWDQYYFTLSQSAGDPSAIRWNGTLAYYYTHDVGQSREGPINNQAYSLSLSGTHNAHTVSVGFQQIASKQFFDYVGQSAGNYLANSLDVDYNAPHEKSVALSYSVDMKDYGVPGLKMTLWTAYGWGADGSAMAKLYSDPASSLHDLYWKNGQPVHGTHYEFGFIPSYTIGSGKLKGTSAKFYYMHHQGQKYYPDSTSDVYRLMVNIPVNVF